jgi:hypothetical protein
VEEVSQGKRFFFKKKNQKTFVPWVPGRSGASWTGVGGP